AGKFYRTFWEASSRLSEAEKNIGLSLVFQGKTERAREIFELLKKDNELISVEFGEQYKKKNENEYTIKNQAEDYVRLIKELKTRSIKRIVHLSSLTEKAVLPRIDKLETSQQVGIYSLFYLIKALTINIVKEKIDIVLLSEFAENVNGKEKEIRPENATLVGFGKAPILEDSNWQCRSIDIDEVTKTENIVAEINSPYLTYKSALRKNLRYIEILKHYNPEVAEKNGLTIKVGGNYLISGGAGGVGLEVATRLAKTNNINLILLNRTKIPERESWSELLLSQNPLDQKFKKIINKIQEIESLGSRAYLFNVDITDRDDAQKTWKKIKKEFSHI
ncbi:MAG: KR domain-containing protein, partial [Candidatus Magasanikbacteria bacterium]|nr:KR domain-containing protein [Candidatus Magasanikbacteria bacterium]